ncbi:MAG TPA: phosphatidylcholine/phosphatidylserine synthase [Mycobacterium sp.]|nr:phosphatidylcholine/phosphatidylserine synthase [Mycobacterium sp.]
MTTRSRGRRAVNLRILPSSMSVLAICAGLTSIRFALERHPDTAIALIAAAAILDGLDGRVARILDAESRMGEEIDSLADAVNFGVAPAVVMYVSLLSQSPAGWVAVLLYAVCIVLRLARFNALLDDATLPSYTREFFVGVPAPAGAIAALAPLAARLQFGDGWWSSPWTVCLWLTACSLLVVSRIPMKKMHAVSVPPNLAALLLAALAIVAAAALLFPYILILVGIAGYLLYIPFSVRSHRWLVAHPEAWGAKPKQRRAARRAIRRAQPNRRSVARLGLRKPGN